MEYLLQILVTLVMVILLALVALSLVLTGPERAPTAPELPTAAEAGMPAFRMEGLQGLFGWRGMPEAVREEFSVRVRQILADPAAASGSRIASSWASACSSTLTRNTSLTCPPLP